MNRLHLYLACFCFLATSLSFTHFDQNTFQNSKDLSCAIENKSFKDGEELKYEIYYNWGLIWLNVGYATFKVKEKGQAYQIIATGKTYKKYDWLYKVNDSYEAVIDKNTLLPIWCARTINENKYTHYEKMTFDIQNKRVISYEGKDKKHLKAKPFSVTDCGHDILSLLYYVRNLNFNGYKIGQIFSFNMILDQNLNKIETKYLGVKPKIEIDGLGSFRALQFSPSTIEGQLFSKGERMNFYVTNDENQIPLFIETTLKVGSIKVYLNSYKNTKGKVTAKL